MRKRSLGQTGLEVSELGLGTWGLCGDGYGPVEDSDREEVLERATALGITLFETADCYAQGRMEEELGKTVAKDERCIVVTKLGTDLESKPKRKRFDRDFLLDCFDKSRRRLDKDVLDVVLLHNPSEKALASGEPTDFLKDRKENHQLRAWGVSAGNLEVAQKAIEVGADVIQLAYNALHSSDLKELESRIAESKVGVLARSVLAYGLLCGQWTTSRIFIPGDHRRKRWSRDQLEERLRQAVALRSAMGGDVTSQRSAALRFALANPTVSACILGPKNTLQLDQLVREAGKGEPYLSEDQKRRLNTRLSNLGVDT